jgi:drug/metabolite transporter (DMT)-like permease
MWSKAKNITPNKLAKGRAMDARVFNIGALLVMGAAWGLTVPLAKIAVSTGHQPFGLIFWQLIVVTAVLGGITLARRKPLVLSPTYWRLFAMVALFGALIPDVVYYTAAAELPAGILSIILASMPLFALPIALALGVDRFAWRKLLGLCFGLSGILLLIGPQASLPEAAMWAFVLLALFAPLSYATEGNLVDLWGTQGLDAMQTLFGASVMGLVVTFPLAIGSGQWINPLNSLGLAEAALVLSSVLHGLVYAGYVWLVGRAGSVFAAQLSYLVNGFGVLWSMMILGETYSMWVWAALGLMVCGVAMVNPRPKQAPM